MPLFFREKLKKMDYILLVGIILGNIAIIVFSYFSNKHSTAEAAKLFAQYRIETFKFSETQKQNTETLVNLLNKLFVSPENQVKSEPNEVTKASIAEFEFSEQNPLKLPKDVKFEVEGGESFIPPGYT